MSAHWRTQLVHAEFERLLSRYRCPDELLLNCEKTVINLWQKKLSDMKMDVASYKVRLKEIGFEIERCAKTLSLCSRTGNLLLGNREIAPITGS